MSRVGGYERTPEIREKISKSKLGKPSYERTQEIKEKNRLGNLGREFTKEHRENLSKAVSGEKSHRWKGGIIESRKRQRAKHYYHNLRIAVLAFMGNKCVRCGFSDSRALQIDHINGGGVKEIKSIGSERIYRKILGGQEWSQTYQLLCANCNWIKRAERHEEQ